LNFTVAKQIYIANILTLDAKILIIIAMLGFLQVLSL